jgi:hypothetical protein
MVLLPCNRIGKISKVYLDDQTGQPRRILVTTGLFGTRQSFAPVHGSRSDGEMVVLAVAKDQVKDAPNIDEDAHISETEKDPLRQYYTGYSAPPRRPAVTRQAGRSDTRPAGRAHQPCHPAQLAALRRRGITRLR